MWQLHPGVFHTLTVAVTGAEDTASAPVLPFLMANLLQARIPTACSELTKAQVVIHGFKLRQNHGLKLSHLDSAGVIAGHSGEVPEEISGR